MEIQSKGGLAPTPTTIITTTNTTFLSANQSHQVHTTQDTLSPITKIIHVIPPQTAATTASHSFAQAFLVVWVLVALLAFFFNCIQITAILLKAKRSRRKKLKGSTILILNLSITDALVGLVMLIFVIMANTDSSSTTTPGESPAVLSSGDSSRESSFEIIATVLLHASWIASLLTLVAVTVDRLMLTVKPMQYQLAGTRKFSVFSCLFIWLVTLIVVCLMGHKFNKNYSKFVNTFLTMLLPCLTLPTCVLMVFCYFVVWKHMSSLNQRLKTYEIKVQCYDGDNDNNIEKKNNDSNGKDAKIECSIAPSLSLHENTAAVDQCKFTKLAITIVGLFTLCWIPISILYIISYTDKTYRTDSQTAFYAGSLFQLLGAFNSVLNPLVYLGTFRKTLAKTCFLRARYDVTSTSNSNHNNNDGNARFQEASVMTPLRKQTQSEVVDDDNDNNGDDDNCGNRSTDGAFEHKKVFEIFY